jgi:hypothetical protein
MAEINGIHKFDERFDRVDKELIDLKDDLAAAIRELSTSIGKQAGATESLEKAVNILATQFHSFLNIAANAIPLKGVGWMFGVVLIFILVLVAGIETLKYMPKLLGFF